ncbi:MAG: VOC family protein [Bacteroidetes bacterium]|nr:VOC family protein [Bacteroidota bacterium]
MPNPEAPNPKINDPKINDPEVTDPKVTDPKVTGSKPIELEHVNLTVRDSRQTAEMLTTLFGWKIRWQGAVLGGAGWTVHVGTMDTYLAVYSPNTPPGQTDRPVPLPERPRSADALNHIGVVVDNLETVQARVKAMGFTTGPIEDYEPGRRFYFDDTNGIEFEVVCYQ